MRDPSAPVGIRKQDGSLLYFEPQLADSLVHYVGAAPTKTPANDLVDAITSYWADRHTANMMVWTLCPTQDLTGLTEKIYSREPRRLFGRRRGRVLEGEFISPETLDAIVSSQKGGDASGFVDRDQLARDVELRIKAAVANRGFMASKDNLTQLMLARFKEPMQVTSQDELLLVALLKDLNLSALSSSEPLKLVLRDLAQFALHGNFSGPWGALDYSPLDKELRIRGVAHRSALRNFAPR